jgi:hypothetical protein
MFLTQDLVKKKDIQEQLRKNCNEYDVTEINCKLLPRVAQYNSKGKLYELDQTANEMGRLVITLPPYHCQYNSLEQIMAQVKGEFDLLEQNFK